MSLTQSFRDERERSKANPGGVETLNKGMKTWVSPPPRLEYLEMGVGSPDQCNSNAIEHMIT